MSRYFINYGLAILLLTMIGCTPKESTPTSLLHDEVMAIHDEVMPKMKDIHQMKKRLREVAKEYPDETISEDIQQLIAKLEKADEAMMDWMAAYKKPSKDDKGAVPYLTDQKEKITLVKKQMLEAIEEAKNRLNAE